MSRVKRELWKEIRTSEKKQYRADNVSKLVTGVGLENETELWLQNPETLSPPHVLTRYPIQHYPNI
jgi:hypothetical protein